MKHRKHDDLDVGAMGYKTPWEQRTSSKHGWKDPYARIYGMQGNDLLDCLGHSPAYSPQASM